jgi:hypothetical protein
VTLPELEALAETGGALKGMLMSAQSIIDQCVTALDTFLTNVSDTVAKLENDGTAPVDTTQLQAVVAQLPALQSSLDALVPATTATTSTTGTPATTHTTATTRT